MRAIDNFQFVVGVRFRRVNSHTERQGVAFAKDLKAERGDLVTEVDAGGPAAAANIHVGDVITSLAGKPVANLHAFHVVLWAHRPGETVDVGLERGGTLLRARASLGTDRGRRGQLHGSPSDYQPREAPMPQLGMRRPVSPARRRRVNSPQPSFYALNYALLEGTPLTREALAGPLRSIPAGTS